MITRTKVEEAQRELNEILERIQTSEQFHQAVDETLARANAPKEEKPAKRKSANRSLLSKI